MIKLIPHALGEGIAGHSIHIEPQQVDHEATRKLNLNTRAVDNFLARRAEYREKIRKVSMGLY